MLIVFPFIFVPDTKKVYCYNFVAPLKENPGPFLSFINIVKIESFIKIESWLLQLTCIHSIVTY